MNLPSLPSTDQAQLSRSNRVFTGWLAESCPSLDSRTVYLNDLKHFSEFLTAANKDIFTIDRQDIQAYLEYLRVNELSSATRAKKLTVIKGLVRALATEDLIPFNVAQKILAVKAPKVPRDGRTPGLSPKEARDLLDAPPVNTLRGIRDRAILATLLYTGARRSAICKICIGHLLSEAGVYYVLLHEKGDRRIRAPLHPEASERIHKWIVATGLSSSDPKSPLFRPFNRRGSNLLDKQFNDFMIWHIVKKYAKSAGLQVDRLGERGICAHSTRVTAITTSFAGGAKLEEIQQLVGHKDPRNTLRYRRVSPKDATNAVMRINY